MTFRRSAATLFLLAAVAVPSAALAAPLKVNSTSDTLGQDCTIPANTCTLRGAIAQAATLGVQEIDLPGVPNTGDVTTYTVGSTLPTITNDITIVGNSPTTTIIESSGPTIFNVTGGTVSLTLSHAEITGASLGEGIVSSNANVTLDDVLLDGNTRTAVHVSGSPPQVIPTLMVTNSTISNNSTFNGGVVWADFATMIVMDDVFDTNTSMGGGSALYHHGSGSITITGSTFNNNKTTNGGSGAAIGGDGTSSMGIQSCTFTNNTASGNGGAVDAAVTNTTIDNSTFDSNTAGDATHPSSGGGLSTGYAVVITKSTFSNNKAFGIGGGAFTGGNDGTMLTATNCTFSGNTAGMGGGGLATGGGSGQLILSNVTIANNTATSGGGGGVQINDIAGIFKNTIIAGNSGSPDPDCEGPMITEDYNLVGNGSGCQINPTNLHDLVGTAMSPIDAGLDPMGLMANGSSGPKTLALTPSSPAGDAANPNGCRDHDNIPITTDERGDPRPVDGNCDNVARCDIGAFEAGHCTLTPPTTTTTTTQSTTSSTTTSTTHTTTSTTTTSTTTTTVTTTTHTTTTTVPPTTSTTTTTASPTTTTVTTTSTTHPVSTTTGSPPTTTTLPAGDCGNEPAAATFASIDCRLVALLARVTGESALGASGPKLVQNLSSAKDAEEAGASACATSDLKRAHQRLKQLIRDMIQYAHHLETLRARKKLPGDLRTDLLAAGNPITDDAKTLKRTVQCPADAP